MRTVSRRVAVRHLGALPIAVAAPLIATPSRSAFGQALPNPVIGEFVGTIATGDEAAPDILVAVIADPRAAATGIRTVRAYLCNGELLAEWFAGEVEGNGFSLTSKNGALFEGELSDAAVAGTVTLANGVSHGVETKPATGIEGLYHLLQTNSGSSGASSRGVLWQYGVDETGLFEGIFVLLDGTIEPIAVALPPASLATEQTPVEEGDVLTTNRLIVVGILPEPRIAGTFIPTRPPRCRYIKRAVVTTSGETVEQYVQVCS